MKVFALCALLLLVSTQVYGLSFTLNAKREECFYENIKDVKQKVFMQFQVSRGGHLDIDLNVFDPSNRVVHHIERSSEGKFTIPATSAGIYKICFSNKMSTLTPKIVSFTLSSETAVDPSKFAKIDELDPIDSNIAKLSEGLASILAEQNYLKDRERAHRAISEQTNSRLLYWAIFEFAALVGMGLFQIYYLRKFFSIKRPVG